MMGKLARSESFPVVFNEDMDLSGFMADGNVSILGIGMFYQVGYDFL